MTTVFKKILIANRGEIACRIIETAKKLGISTVAVYSDVDAHALHVEMADEAVAIGNAPPNESYLSIAKIVEAARQTGADAIHPGYGFLSENVVFRQACDAQGLVFIGPSAEAIKAMGSKSAAKLIMDEAGVPVVPGFHGQDQEPTNLKKLAKDMGFPVLLKASAGGGGKGMRQVWSLEDFDEALKSAKRESLKSFGDDKMLIEKYIAEARHVEVQVFCDEQGNGVYLGDRDCSMQRRHQKIIEEAPAPNLDSETRKAMGETAVRAAQAIQYCGAGTVEFLLDNTNAFYFIEMNTRLQVEHPVTEMVTGQDLVEWQINVAQGEGLPIQQDHVTIQGHAFEARIYAEDPENNFLPASGKLTKFAMPAVDDTVRIDTGVREHDNVSVFYDPMIAKLIVWGKNRDEALATLRTSLRQCHVDGVKTNLRYLYNLASLEPFKQIEFDTGFIDNHHESILKSGESDQKTALLFGALYKILKLKTQEKPPSRPLSGSPWDTSDTWRMNQPSKQLIPLFLEAEMHEVMVTQGDDEDGYLLSLDRSFSGHTTHVAIRNAQLQDGLISFEIDQSELRAVVTESEDYCQFFTQTGVFTTTTYSPAESSNEVEGSRVVAAFHGTVVNLIVDEGQAVVKGDPLLVMEAMKMEHTIAAPSDGVVTQFYFKAGDMVEEGAELLDLATAE